jgi:hypothetical protein
MAQQTWAVETADGSSLVCIFKSANLVEWRETLDRLFGVAGNNAAAQRRDALERFRVLRA